MSTFKCESNEKLYAFATMIIARCANDLSKLAFQNKDLDVAVYVDKLHNEVIDGLEKFQRKAGKVLDEVPG